MEKTAKVTRPEIIRRYLLNLIFSSRNVGDAIPSERELCARFKVTRPTVRLALTGLIDEGYLVTRPGRGTFIARNLNIQNEFDQPMRTIAILVGDGRNVVFERYSWELVAAAGLECARLGANIRQTGLLAGSSESLLNELRFLRADGIIWIIPPENALQMLRQLHAEGVPSICVNRAWHDECLNSVTLDFLGGGRELGNLLCDRGMRNICFLRRIDNESGNYLFEGVKESFARRGINFSDHLTIDEGIGTFDILRIMFQRKVAIDAIYVDATQVSQLLKLMNEERVVPGRDVTLISSSFRMELSPQVSAVKLDFHWIGSAGWPPVG